MTVRERIRKGAHNLNQQFNTQKMTQKELPDKLREALGVEFSPIVDDLEALTDRDLSHWSVT